MMSSEHPGVVVAGGINMDLVAVTPRFPRPGETVKSGRFFTTPGGKGANQAVAAARMGARTWLVGRVGGDQFGPALLVGLREADVDVRYVSTDPAQSSGIAVIWIDEAGQNCIVQVPGANAACDEQEVQKAVQALEGASLVLLQNELPWGVTEAVAREAHLRGKRVILNPAPAGAVPEEARRLFDLVTPNESEASFLTGVDVQDGASAREAASLLRSMGFQAGVVTLGEQGAYYWAEEGEGHLEAFRVQAVDTVAAGDAFNGALGVALAEGRPLREAVQWGMAAGAISVTRPGAQAAMPYRSEVEALLRRATGRAGTWGG